MAAVPIAQSGAVANCMALSLAAPSWEGQIGGSKACTEVPIALQSRIWSTAAVEEGALIVDNATMENNWATSGGAINMINTATAVIKGGSVFRNNSAEDGGGLLANLYCNVTLEGCIFVNNHATGQCLDGRGCVFSRLLFLSCHTEWLVEGARMGSRSQGMQPDTVF